MAVLDGTTILIVGATGGLGSEFARQLDGATLVLTGRDAAKLASLAPFGETIAADLLLPGQAEELIARATAATGALDGIIIASGVVAFGPAAEVDDDTIDELFLTNTIVPMRIIRAARESLVASAEAGRSPFIVTISGVVSESPTVGLAAYSASKAALAAFDQVAGRELRRAGIRVLDARPGHTETGLAAHPIAGAAPGLPEGFAPADVVARIIRGIVDDEKDLPSSSFTA